MQTVGGCMHLQGLMKAAGYLDRPSTTLLEETTTDASMCVSRYHSLQGRAHSFRHCLFFFFFFFPFFPFFLSFFPFPFLLSLPQLDHFLFVFTFLPIHPSLLCPLHWIAVYLVHCASTLSCLSLPLLSLPLSLFSLLLLCCTAQWHEY